MTAVGHAGHAGHAGGLLRLTFTTDNTEPTFESRLWDTEAGFILAPGFGVALRAAAFLPNGDDVGKGGGGGEPSGGGGGGGGGGPVAVASAWFDLGGIKGFNDRIRDSPIHTPIAEATWEALLGGGGGIDNGSSSSSSSGSSSNSSQCVAPEEVAAVRASLWNKYKEEVVSDPVRLEEMYVHSAVSDAAGKSMRFTCIHPSYTLYTPFIAVYTPIYTRYTCIHTIYTPYIHL